MVEQFSEDGSVGAVFPLAFQTVMFLQMKKIPLIKL